MECFLESRGNRTDKVLLQSFCKWVSIFSDLESIVYSNFTKYLEIPLLEREDAGVTELFKRQSFVLQESSKVDPYQLFGFELPTIFRLATACFRDKRSPGEEKSLSFYLNFGSALNFESFLLNPLKFKAFPSQHEPFLLLIGTQKTTATLHN